MEDYKRLYHFIINDPRYTEGITYGKPHTGHAEGTVKAHLVDLENNLKKLDDGLGIRLHETEYWKLKILIHTHDTFKFWAKRDSAIEDPQSHASLAKKFLAEFTQDEDLLNIVQYHDEGYALWKQVETRGSYNKARFTKAICIIKDLELFLFFTILDGFTPSKEPKRIRWFINEVDSAVADHITKLPRIYWALEVFGI
jgi:hypothetical protein